MKLIKPNHKAVWMIMRFSCCASVNNALNRVQSCMLGTLRCHSAQARGRRWEKSNVNILGLPIWLSPRQGVSDTIINLRENGLDWVLEVIWTGHLGVEICKLRRVNLRVSMNDVLYQFYECDPSVAQEIVFQG
jgi:hypothetical protein